jgi:glycosyltransferase involved in cell wall biosynthesis
MTSNLPKLCLNMIVKNESKIITRLFDSVLDIIDSYCICDTGSTDNTVTIIDDYFKKNGKPGKVISESFKDFGYNRTHSLLACQGEPNADYILLMDADMILEKGPDFNLEDFKNGLDRSHAYYILQGSSKLSYKNVRIVKNNIGATYWGVTHEYVKMPHGSKYSSIEKNILFINDVGDGGAKADKFERDIRLLLKGLEDEPNNDRYTFYLANSYRENGQREKAIETYKKRIEIGGWIEEIWESYYNIGKCYMILGEPEKAIATWLEGYDRFPKRLENIYEIMAYYRTQSKHRLVYEFYKIAKKRLDEIVGIGDSLDHLFMQNDVYDYKIDYEFTISGYYYNPDKINIADLCMKVLAVSSIEDGIIKNMMANYKFYAPKLVAWKDIDMTGRSWLLPPDFYQRVNIEPSIHRDFSKSTPTFCHLDEGKKTIVNVRHVNYKIGEKGEYINKDRIITKNAITIYDNSARAIEKEFEMNYDKELDGLYVGLEDVRFIEHKNEIHFTANRGLEPGLMCVEYGKIDINTQTTTSHVLIKTDGITNIEKNWVLYETGDRDALRIVYNWYPMTTYGIGADGKSLTDKRTMETPTFFKHLRGSTNGISVFLESSNCEASETWFLCHAVSYEDRRHYYHIIVAIDADTGKITRWSKFFTFEGKPVEYALGFTHNKSDDTFMFGYSTMDRTTEYRKTSKELLMALFV